MTCENRILNSLSCEELGELVRQHLAQRMNALAALRRGEITEEAYGKTQVHYSKLVQVLEVKCTGQGFFSE